MRPCTMQDYGSLGYVEIGLSADIRNPAMQPPFWRSFLSIRSRRPLF